MHSKNSEGEKRNRELDAERFLIVYIMSTPGWILYVEKSQKKNKFMARYQ